METSILQDNMPGWPLCFIKFRVMDQERFQLLAHAFEVLKQEKHKLTEAAFGDNEGHIPEDNEKHYDTLHEQALRKLTDSLFDLFDEQTLAHFWWPSKQEAQDYWQRWLATPKEQRFTDPALNISWDFESIIDSFLNGEYELLACRLLTSDIGMFEFLPFAFPYGGRDCMKALIGAFDFPIIGEDYGTGYISYL